MKTQLSISEMVAKVRASGTFCQPPKKRRYSATEEAEMRVPQTIVSHNTDDDSDFEDSFISNEIWDKMYKHEEKEYDQLIFNIFRQDMIPNQEQKVNVTTAASIRDCPERAEEIAMWSKLVAPVLSRAPRKRTMSDIERAERDAELNRVLADSVEEIKQSAINDSRSE